MVSKADKNAARVKRHFRVRNKISGTPERPRLNVFRSAKHIYAQIIDDINGVTLAAASNAEAGGAVLVANNYKGAELHNASAFDGFGYAVDSYNFFSKIKFRSVD